MPPKKKIRTAQYFIEERARRAEKGRLRRQRLTPEQRDELREKERIRKRNSNANATEEQKQRKAEIRRNRKAQMDEEKKTEIRKRDAEAKRRRRINKTDEELAFERLMQDDDLNLLETDASCQSASNHSADNQQTIQNHSVQELNKRIDVSERNASSQSATSSEINQTTLNESSSIPAIPVQVPPSQPSVNSHECPHCPEKQIFPFRSGLDRHLMLMHKNEMDNSCQTCGSKYNNEFAAHQHHMSKKCLLLPIAVKQEAPTCPHCIKIFAFRSQLDRHLAKKHSDQLDNLCERCGLKYANNFVDHEHHLSKKCPKSIKIPVMKKSACEICGKFYATEQGMRLHLRITHGIDAPQLNCTTCGFNASTPEDLLKHNQTSHTKETFSCECGNTSACLLTYYTHIKSCPFEQTVPSNTTKKISKVKAQPKIPVVPILSIQCTKCIQKFKSEVERTIHNRTHGKNFRCTLCRGIFETLEGLNIHRNKAHGISLCDVIPGQTKRTYYCSVCHKGFITSTGLKNHQISAHPNYIPLQKTAPRTSSLVIETYNYTMDANTLSFSDRAAAKPDSHAQQVDYDDDEQEEVEEEFTPLECQVCSTIFLNALDLKNHEAEEHHNNSEEDCPIKSEIKLEVLEPEEEDMIFQPEFPVPMQLQLEGDEIFDSFAIIPTNVLKM